MESFQRYLGENGLEIHQDRNYLNETGWKNVNEVRRQAIQSNIRPDAVVLEFCVGTGWNLSGLQCAQRLGYEITVVANR